MFDQNNLNTPNKKESMHPEDMRNMFIFFAIAAVLYFAYNFYVLKPQKEAMIAAQKAQAELAAKPDSPIAKKLAEIQNPLPRDEALSLQSAQRIKIDNGTVFGSISTKGGRIDDIALSNYFDTLKKENNVAVLSPDRAVFPRYIEYGWVSSDKTTALPNKDTIWQLSGNEKLTAETPVTLTWNNGNGLTFKRTISIDEEFMFQVTQNVKNTSGKDVTLYPFGLISQRGQPPYFAATWISHEGPIGYIGESLEQVSYSALRKGKNEVLNADRGWIGITDKYWLAAFVPPQGEDVKYSMNYVGPRKDPKNIGRYQADYLGAPVSLTNGQSADVQTRLFVGAKKVLTLQKYQKDLNIPKFDLAVDFGLLWFMSKPFFYILHYAGIYIGNFGVAIIILTIAIRGAVFPLTNMSYRSFAGMKKVAPQIAKLREEIGDDKQKMQEELIKLYQKEGVNPMSGCLPIILQIPIFFALYKILFITIEMRHAPFFGWIQDLSAADPTSIFNLFGLIPWDPPSILMIGVWPCVMLVAMLVQKNLNPPPQEKIQKDMATYMPFFFAFIMSKFAAGLVIYWSFSAIIGVIQQIIIMKSMNVPIHLFGETPDEEILEANEQEAAEKKAEQEPEEEEAPKEPKAISKPKPKKSKKKK